MTRVAALSLLLVAACTIQTGPGAREPGGAEQAPAAEGWVLLRVENVATERREWDGPVVEERKPGWFCNLLGAAVGVGAAVAGGGLTGVGAGVSAGGSARGACAWLSGRTGRQVQRLPEAPDLYVALRVDGRVRYRTPTLVDTQVASFGYRFIVPLEAVPADGIELAVFDADQGGDELVGVLRLSRAELAAGQGGGLAARPVPGLSLFELAIDPMPPSFEPIEVFLEAQAGQLLFGDVPAGAVVEVRAGGQVRFAARKGWEAGPAGVPGTEGHKGNHAPAVLRKAAHGAAYLAVGDGDQSRIFLTGRCLRYAGSVGGALLLGLNDAGDRRDNAGRMSFLVSVIPPSAEEWRQPDSAGRCR